MDALISSHEILMALVFINFIAVFIGSQMKMYVPAKIYKSFFAFVICTVTAYIVYTCIAEPFNNVMLAIFGYLFVYFSFFLVYGSLKHWMINPEKVYSFYPENILDMPDGERVLSGYITEAGQKFLVRIDDEEYYLKAKKDVPFSVKYREWKNFTARFDVIELNQ